MKKGIKEDVVVLFTLFKQPLKVYILYESDMYCAADSTESELNYTLYLPCHHLKGTN